MNVYKKTIEQFKKDGITKFQDKITSIILYGSAARGEYRQWESDIDLLVIGNEDKSLEQELSKITGEIDLENGTATSLVYFSEMQFKRYFNLGSPFLEDVLEGGIILYDNGFFERFRKGIIKAS